MKLSNLSIIAAVLAGACAGSLRPAMASSQATTIHPPLTRLGETLLSQRSRLRFRTYVRPSRYRYGGFTRGGICRDDSAMTVMVPPTRPEESIDGQKGAIDYTVSARPTFLVHVPELEAPTTAQFTLQDEKGEQQLYNATINLSGEAGILGIQLPETAPALEVGGTYIWQMAIDCGSEDATRSLFIGSWLQRISLDSIEPTEGFDPSPLIDELPTASEERIPAIYAELGIWQDALASLAALRLENPNDSAIAADWRALLEDTNTVEFVEAPILTIEVYPAGSASELADS